MTRDDLEELVRHQADFIISSSLPPEPSPGFEVLSLTPVECAVALDLAGRFDDAMIAYR